MTVSTNVTLKVNRAITGATTVNANCYAVVTYTYGGYTPSVGGDFPMPPVAFERVFGPGQSIPASMLFGAYGAVNAGYGTLNYSLASGYELINTP